MNPWTADFLANLAAELTAQVVAGLGRRLRDTLSGDEQQKALRQAAQAGVLALLATAGDASTEEAALLKDICEDFFRDPEVGREVADWLRGRPADREELAHLFREAGYDAETLPGLDLQPGLAAFEGAFLTAAVDEPALQGLIQAGQALAQTGVQRELLAAVRELVAMVRRAEPGSLSVSGGTITGRDAADGRPVTFHLTPAVGPVIPPPDALRVAYLKRQAQTCGALRLLGLDTGAGQAAGEDDVRLESIYIHLDTQLPFSRVVTTYDEEARHIHTDREGDRPLTALEAVALFSPLALTGGPGAGKSTLASYLVLCLATLNLPAEERRFEIDPAEHLPGWPASYAPLPLHVTLRDFARELPADTRRGTADLLWRHIERCLAPLDEFAGALKTALLAGEALVVLDGLDEVPEASQERKASPRKLVLQAVEDFALRAFPKARYLVTGRVASYVDPWTLKDFEAVELAEFDQAKRDRFCELWYVDLVRRGQLDAARQADKVASLQEAIRRPDLARMAGVPLLLTVMALVHARETELPEARALLYEKCVDVLLWLWERHKAAGDEATGLLELLQEAGVDRTFFVRALDRLAYDVHEQGGGEAGEADIRSSLLERRLELLHPARDPRWARRVATFLRERAGLLVERRADEVDPVLAFPHRTFQEYLAACWLTKEEDTACKAAELARQGDQWWEVVKLAAGRLLYVEHKVSAPLALVDWLCPAQEPGTRIDWRMAILAGQVLLELKPEQMRRDEEIGPRIEVLLARVRGRLCELMEGGHLSARQRAAGGDLLARLGDPRPEVMTLEGMWFCWVPAGPVVIGSSEREADARDNERPQHELDIPYGYWIGYYPLTAAQWRAFLELNDVKPEDTDSLRDLDNRPTRWLSWHEVQGFCAWLTARWRHEKWLPPGWMVQLPSEVEWEKAARGGLWTPDPTIVKPVTRLGEGIDEINQHENPAPGRRFPWGEQTEPENANYDDSQVGDTSAVGCFPGGRSPYGCQDLSGNVWEWTRSKYGDYPHNFSDERENLRAGVDVRRVLRGGAYYLKHKDARCASRSRSFPYIQFRNYGLRLVIIPPSALSSDSSEL